MFDDFNSTRYHRTAKPVIPGRLVVLVVKKGQEVALGDTIDYTATDGRF